MASTGIYRDIQKRTGGDIYIGVDRAPFERANRHLSNGSWTLWFFRRLKTNMPWRRIVDELPQSGSGENGYDNSTEICSE